MSTQTNLFLECFQFEGSFVLTRKKQSMNLFETFKDGTSDSLSFDGCKNLKSIFEIFMKGINAFCFDFKIQAFFVFNNKKIAMKEVFKSLDEDVIDLQSLNGIQEGKKRFFVLYYILLTEHFLPEKEKLFKVEDKINIGVFKIPKDKLISVFLTREDDGVWRFCVETNTQEFEPVLWLGFSDKLKIFSRVIKAKKLLY